ncbi:flagellar motor protein MotD [Motiliproteus sediminis]|uniref:flagellar motor protein MotD n=1 Tax=Motiliproteus sediminis TaxID=1468178 RepID=UPI001AEFCFF6|nr:flagellar motor protein MotD [Motiliproteus sediminis]
MARRRRSRDEVSHERWVVSYADFITLLLAFFVVMYSISSVNEGKYRVLSESLAGVFRGAEFSMDPIQVGDVPRPFNQRDIGLLGETPSVPPGGLESERRELQQIGDDAKKHFQELIADGKLTVSSNKLWVEIEIGSNLLFPSGSATPVQAADPLLEALATLLAPYDNPVHVEGFTDNRPIENGAFPTNWELSAARAAAVVRVLSHYGVAPERLAAVGYGEYQPKVSNRTARGRSINRRVKIIVSRDERVRRALSSYGSGYISEDAVQTILSEKVEAEQAAPVERIETEEGGVLFTRGAPEQ